LLPRLGAALPAGAHAECAIPVPCRRRIAKATGGQVVMALADMDGNESFEASSLGTAEEVRRRSKYTGPV